MSQFLVLYTAPAAVIQEWMQTPEEERKAQTDQMQGEWQTWMGTHASAVITTAGAGKNKRVTKDGVNDVTNDIMLYSIVEAESHEAAAKMFENHTHLQIPQAAIEVMPVNELPM
ncbi:MAG TPA: hypothetical protein VGB97_04230 [Candidatus Paceibacterota bacterium]|jgi:hypothetical protein